MPIVDNKVETQAENLIDRQGLIRTARRDQTRKLGMAQLYLAHQKQGKYHLDHFLLLAHFAKDVILVQVQVAFAESARKPAKSLFDSRRSMHRTEKQQLELRPTEPKLRDLVS